MCSAPQWLNSARHPSLHLNPDALHVSPLPALLALQAQQPCAESTAPRCFMAAAVPHRTTATSSPEDRPSDLCVQLKLGARGHSRRWSFRSRRNSRPCCIRTSSSRSSVCVPIPFPANESRPSTLHSARTSASRLAPSSPISLSIKFRCASSFHFPSTPARHPAPPVPIRLLDKFK
eukprot:3379762-Rhodomonas_salina.1